MFESLFAAFGAVSGAALGAVWIALGIFLFPVVANAITGIVGLGDKVNFHFPEGNVWDLRWLGNPWVAMYTLGTFGVVVAYVAHVVR